LHENNAGHINNLLYSKEQLYTYKLLYDIVKDKNYFVITTNADFQFFKGGFYEEFYLKGVAKVWKLKQYQL